MSEDDAGEDPLSDCTDGSGTTGDKAGESAHKAAANAAQQAGTKKALVRLIDSMIYGRALKGAGLTAALLASAGSTIFRRTKS